MSYFLLVFLSSYLPVFLSFSLAFFLSSSLPVFSSFSSWFSLTVSGSPITVLPQPVAEFPLFAIRHGPQSAHVILSSFLGSCLEKGEKGEYIQEGAKQDGRVPKGLPPREMCWPIPAGQKGEWKISIPSLCLKIFVEMSEPFPEQSGLPTTLSTYLLFSWHL